MRIAISGAHRTGKSTLVSELAALLPSYSSVDEPYYQLEEEGYEAAHPPSLDDFEAQLERSLEAASEAGDEVVFDRCAVDLLAYIAVHERADDFDLDDWLPRVRDALESLDLVVFVPIEDPDRIVFSASDDDPESRAAVDEKLRELLIDDALGLGLRVLEVAGDPDQRARSVLRALRRGAR